MPHRWLSTKRLLSGAPIFEAEPGTVVQSPRDKAKIPDTATIKAKPTGGLNPPPEGRMGEYAHDEPSLASRSRPDLGSAADRHKAFKDGYHDKEHHTEKMTHRAGSTGTVFHKKMSNGSEHIVKPLEGAGGGRRAQGLPDDGEFHEPKQWSSRHQTKYDVMAAMGAHHMVVPGMAANVHKRDRLGSGIPDADAEKGHHDQLNFEGHTKAHEMGANYAGKNAHVTEFAKGSTPMFQMEPEDLDKVDHEHRLHGIVAHVLFGNGDGHEGNILMHESGHPILIDHDLTLDSQQGKMFKEKNGKKTIRSQFAPGGLLDYQANMPDDVTTVGSNFPPRMMATLKSIADGTLKHGLGNGDAAQLKEHAAELLSGGLEKTLENRHVHWGPDDRKRK
jgi:hypothetical protein